jgi:hypothetical protein
LEEKLSIKFKNCNFSGVKVSIVLGLLVWMSTIGCKTMKFRDLQESLYTRKIFMVIFEFDGRFFFQNNVFHLQEDFSEHGIRVFLENELGSFKTFLFYRFQTNERW